MSKCLDCSCRNISHTCSGWTWSMPSTKVWSVSSFPTLWVWISTQSSHLNILFLYLRYSLSPVFILVSCQNPPPPLSPLQAYSDSDVDLFTWGTPITTIALLTILVHLGVETKTWVRSVFLNLLMTASSLNNHPVFMSVLLWHLKRLHYLLQLIRLSVCYFFCACSVYTTFSSLHLSVAYFTPLILTFPYFIFRRSYHSSLNLKFSSPCNESVSSIISRMCICLGKFLT